MKKTTLLVLFASLLLAINVNAQEKKSMINLRLGIGSSYTGSGSSFETNIPPVEASYETFISDELTVGGFAGISSSAWKYAISSISVKTDYTYITFGGLVNYYFVNEDPFQVYAGGKLGYVNAGTESSISGSGLSDDQLESILSKAKAKASGFAYSLNVGGRYWFTDSIAVNAELGYGISTLGIGLTIGF